jgi:hypothetical protein
MSTPFENKMTQKCTFCICVSTLFWPLWAHLTDLFCLGGKTGVVLPPCPCCSAGWTCQLKIDCCSCAVRLPLGLLVSGLWCWRVVVFAPAHEAIVPPTVNNRKWLFCTECRPKRPVLYIIPVTDILGRLALVPYGEHGTIPYDWRNLVRYYPRGECDGQNRPGSGSKLYYINSWAMLWPSDHPRDSRVPTSWKDPWVCMHYFKDR